MEMNDMRRFVKRRTEILGQDIPAAGQPMAGDAHLGPMVSFEFGGATGDFNLAYDFLAME